ncbi:MAG: ABC transporter permease subunit [Gammaproteobacteria bacterium]|jgi:sodium transport system permease protein
MSLFKTVFKKELRDSLRDRRAIMISLLPALFAPILMATMFHFMVQTRVSTNEITVPIIGMENAPDLIQYLEQNEVTFTAYEGDPKADIQNKNVKIVMEIPDDFEENFAQSKPAIIYIHSDGSLDKSRADDRRISGLINQYSRTIGNMRLMIHGVNPQIANAVSINDKDYSTDESRAGQILAGLQIFIMMAAFFGSAPTAIDLTAGERERNSLEPLLVHPLTSANIMLGKWLTVVTYGLLATIIAVVVTAIAFEFVSLKAAGIDPKLTVTMQISMIVLLIPNAMFAAGLQMLTSLFAKSFKEAQSYLGFLVFIPMAPVIITMIGGMKAEGWMFMVPVLGQQQILTNIMRGEAMILTQFLSVTAVTVVVSAIILTVLTKLLRSERVVYGS